MSSIIILINSLTRLRTVKNRDNEALNKLLH